MKHSLLVRWSAACLLAAALGGCGGGGGGGASEAPAQPGTPAAFINTAATVASNDTATNSSASFDVVQAAGVPAVTINSPPKVNFAVFSDGRVKTGLAITNVRFALAKLVPGVNGDPDQWVNYIYQKEIAKAGVGPGGVPFQATAMQATTDGKQTDAALLAIQLVYNPDGYYTYTFKTDIKDIAQTNGVVFEPGLTHRVAIQLSYQNAAGQTVLVNPYFDFTVVDGKSVPVTDPAKTRKMTDIASCNGCHEKLALHGGGRVDTQYCVMCHNPGTTDANSGSNLNLATMVHKLHSGKLLKQKLDLGKGGEDYTIWGYKDTKYNYAEVGFPQDLRNCTKCHSAANPKTPQGDNWKTKPSKEACLTCHANNLGSDWQASHVKFVTVPGTEFFIAPDPKKKPVEAKDLPNAACAKCHAPSSNIAPERVHWNQNEENAAKYKMNIESTTYDATTRKVTVKYFVSNPTSGDAAYNLVTPDCTFTNSPGSCVPVPPPGKRPSSNAMFGNIKFYVAYQTVVGQSTAVTEYSSYNNGGGGSAFAHMGTNVGGNHYSLDILLPPDTLTSKAAGTARVVSIGQIKEAKLQVKAATDPRPEVTPKELVNTVMQHTFKELALDGTLTPRRAIVSNEKCNVCHGALGAGSGSNTLANAFHDGANNTVEACVACHDANRVSPYTVMTNGLALNESYQFKRMIHGIHGNSKRTYPFTHGNTVQGAFCNPANTSAAAKAACIASLVLAPTVSNFAAEVAWPGVGINCNACHINNSYKQDLGQLGSVVLKPIITPAVGTTKAVVESDPNKLMVISPKAASCTSCHDSSTAISHVTSFGGAAFGNKTQSAIFLGARETCDDCHSSGGFKGVDIVHGQK